MIFDSRVLENISDIIVAVNTVNGSTNVITLKFISGYKPINPIHHVKEVISLEQTTVVNYNQMGTCIIIPLALVLAASE